jgi:hypothetical protein
MKNYFNIFRWTMIVFSVYVLYVVFGMYMNSSVCLTYESASVADIENVNMYSKIVLVYIIFMIVFLVVGLRRK